MGTASGIKPIISSLREDIAGSKQGQLSYLDKNNMVIYQSVHDTRALELRMFGQLSRYPGKDEVRDKHHWKN